jgi:hypothetical protein
MNSGVCVVDRANDLFTGLIPNTTPDRELAKYTITSIGLKVNITMRRGLTDCLARFIF